MVVWDRRGEQDAGVGELNLGVCKDLVYSIIGLFSMTGEGYVRSGEKINGGGRLLGTSKLFYIQAGIDYSLRYEDLNFVMSCMIPIRRGGPLGKGGSLRLDWFPGQNHSLSLGLMIPLGQPHMGKTRPTSTHVPLPEEYRPSRSLYAPGPELRETLAHLRHAADWINRFTIPFLDQTTKTDESHIAVLVKMIREFQTHIHLQDHLYPQGHTFEAEVDVYHQMLDSAFSLAAREKRAVLGDTSCTRVTHKAREVLLEEVILPYNRLLGQQKKNDSVLGFGSLASSEFEAWLQASSDIPVDNHTAVMYVFQTLIEYIDQNRARSLKTWEDSRLVWIPMHYALRFQDHDTERELDAIIEKAVQQQFTDANDVHYVLNELFQPELERTIKRAEDYHVLWIHDYRGLNDLGEPDEISYQQTVEGYLQALIDKVKAYDTTGKIPVYMIFFDQHYFELNHGRLWMSLLENPLEHEIHLPVELRDWEERIRTVQNDLQAAVIQSPALQADARRFGKKWLTNQIKVHVNITNPFDLSFRSPSLIKYLSFTPDNIMRDHRKITFYDVTELDPSKGEAIYTGMGVGEHYAGPTWDDRAVLARGPVLLSLKHAARELLLSQGFDQSEIPVPLRALPKPQNYDEMLERLRAKGWTATALEVHNTTGFGPKSANIVKAILYNLMPKGSHLYVPDCLWNGPFWGGMLVGAALRGCTVLVVCPAVEHTPSHAPYTMSRVNELFTRFVIIQNHMCEEIESAGGLFKVGIYSMNLDVGDIIGKIQAINDGIAKSEVFQKLFPFCPSVVKMIAEMPEFLTSAGIKPSYLFEEEIKRKPQLHLKSQFFATGQTIKTATPLEGWEPVIRKYILCRTEQVAGNKILVDAKDLRAELEKDTAALSASWGEGLTQRERDKAFLYLTVGSQNQDYRSMIMDGETLLVIGHTWAMIAYLDFVSLMGQTTWIEDIQQLEEFLPRRTPFWKWLGSQLKTAL